MSAPLLCQWDGEAFRPTSPFMQRQADRQYVVGETYRLVHEEERSDASHRHEFAWLRNAWENLPPQYAEAFPTPEHLRKRALIEAGFFDEQTIDAGTNAAALRVAAFAKAQNGFAATVVRGPIVIVRTAKSQSRRAMGKEDFQRSKDAILEIVAGLIGVAPEDVRRAA